MKTMMVMGDSLGQGCRNLSVTAKNCAEAYGTVIASVLECAPLKTAKYPKPVLFDLLDELRRLDIDILFYIPQLLSKVQKNLDFWAGNEWMVKKGSLHDNVSITGANYEDLFEKTAGDFRDAVETFSKKKILDILVAGNIADLHRSITGMYALNPAGDNDQSYWKKTAFDIVKERTPDYLFVDIGHNSKDSAFFGSASDAIPYGKQGAFAPSRYIASMTKVIRNLQIWNAGRTNQTQIFVSVLPKMSAVAALVPVGKFRKPYYEAYEPTLSVSKSFLTGSEMAVLDKAVLDANEEVVKLINAANAGNANITVVDAFTFFDELDYKNSSQTGSDLAKQIKAGTHRLDNRFVQGLDVWVPDPQSSKPRGHWECRFELGGFEGMDGMHPSAVGYAQYALNILEKCMKVKVSAKMRAEILNNAFVEDTLLSNFPVNLKPVMNLLKLLRQGTAVETLQDDDLPIGVAISMLKQSHSTKSMSYTKDVIQRYKKLIN